MNVFCVRTQSGTLLDPAFSHTGKAGSRWARFQMDPQHLEAFYRDGDMLSILLGVIQAGMEEANQRNEHRNERTRQIQAFAQDHPTKLEFLPIFMDTFDELDVCDAGYLTMGQLVHASGGRSCMTRVKEFFVQLDQDHNGQLDFNEFCKYVLRSKKSHEEGASRSGTKSTQQRKQSMNLHKDRKLSLKVTSGAKATPSAATAAGGLMGDGSLL